MGNNNDQQQVGIINEVGDLGGFFELSNEEKEKLNKDKKESK